MRTFFILFIVCSFHAGLAAPCPPLENDLVRAKTIYIGRLISHDDENALSFEVTSVLRGKADEKTILTREECPKMTGGALYLLISQGDNRYGKPRNVVGRPMECQGVWCGWLILPVATVNNQQFVERIYSFVNGEPYSDGSGGLKMERVISLIEKFPYNPHVNDDIPHTAAIK